jgi:hypothetical protein
MDASLPGANFNPNLPRGWEGGHAPALFVRRKQLPIHTLTNVMKRYSFSHKLMDAPDKLTR